MKEERTHPMLHKTAASTLIEVIISMVITAMATTIGIMIFLNVATSTLSLQQLKASGILNKHMQTIRLNPDKDDEIIQIEDFQLMIESSEYSSGGDNNLRQVNISITNNDGKELAHRKQLILMPHE